MRGAAQGVGQEHGDGHRADAAGAYRARFDDGPHRFDQEMQDDALAWLGETLG